MLRPFSLAILRISLGMLMVFWGVDKIINVSHAVAVSNRFYFGLLDGNLIWQIFGVIQVILGLTVVTGVKKRIVYPLLLAINSLTLLGVWKSVIDPWGWFFPETNVLFYPSLIIVAGCLTLLAFRAEDEYSIGY